MSWAVKIKHDDYNNKLEQTAKQTNKQTKGNRMKSSNIVWVLCPCGESVGKVAFPHQEWRFLQPRIATDSVALREKKRGLERAQLSNGEAHQVIASRSCAAYLHCHAKPSRFRKMQPCFAVSQDAVEIMKKKKTTVRPSIQIFSQCAAHNYKTNN